MISNPGNGQCGIHVAYAGDIRRRLTISHCLSIVYCRMSGVSFTWIPSWGNGAQEIRRKMEIPSQSLRLWCPGYVISRILADPELVLK